MDPKLYTYASLEQEMAASELRADFAEVISRVTYRQDCVVVTRSGKRVAALIPVGLYEHLMERLEQELSVEGRRAMAAPDNGPVPLAEAKRRLLAAESSRPERSPPRAARSPAARASSRSGGRAKRSRRAG
jgi:prevent-host-death family protein